MNKTLNIAGFVEERLAEDESAALEAASSAWDEVASRDQAADNVRHVARQSPARVLRDVAAKRAILARHQQKGFDGDVGKRDDVCREDGDWWPCATVRALGSVDADHEDFREEWSRT